MRPVLLLTAVLALLATGCATPAAPTLSVPDRVATSVSGTLTAEPPPPTSPPATPTSPPSPTVAVTEVAATATPTETATPTPGADAPRLSPEIRAPLSGSRPGGTK